MIHAWVAGWVEVEAGLPDSQTWVLSTIWVFSQYAPLVLNTTAEEALGIHEQSSWDYIRQVFWGAALQGVFE